MEIKFGELGIGQRFSFRNTTLVKTENIPSPGGDMNPPHTNAKSEDGTKLTFVWLDEMVIPEE
jgi:hypothetical protein